MERQRLHILLLAPAVLAAAASAAQARADAFAPSAVAPGQRVTLSGHAKPGSSMSAYFYCTSASCGETHVGVTTVDGAGNYALGFSVPPGAKPGPAYVKVGCDTCGNGWRRVDGLAIAMQQPPAPPQQTFAPGQCRDSAVTRAITETIGRGPKGSGDGGECNARLYGNGSWSSYEDLKAKVRASIFDANEVNKRTRCFGAQGANCNALEASFGNAKAGRTALPNGHYAIWISVGSIKHDNCCQAFPNGKMCGGAPDATPEQKKAATDFYKDGDNHCVWEWDKAFWNASDGRAWTEEFDPNRVPDLRLVNNPRQARARTGALLVAYETAETRRFSAPRGQALDVGDESFCASGRAKGYEVPFTPKKWIVCE
jgi:hypothetical protein